MSQRSIRTLPPPLTPARHRARRAAGWRSASLLLAVMLGGVWMVPGEAHAQTTSMQPAPTPQRMTRALPGDPGLWQHHLNHFGQQGWEVVGIQPVSSGSLTLYLVTYQRTSTATPVQYSVLLSEFPRDANPDSLVSAKAQLEIQTNEHGRAGWEYLLFLAGQHRSDEFFLSLVFKKAAP